MKKIIIASLLMFAFADPAASQNFKTKNGERFQQSFAKNFPGTLANVWDTQGEFILARFYMNEIKFDAWFTKDAGLYAVAKYTIFDQLPAKVSEAVKKKYGTIEPVSAMEIVKTNGRHYYVTKIHYKKSLHTIRVSPKGKIEVVKRETP